MAIIEHDWVWETATVSGTGSVTLPGTPAQTGARTFVSVYANNDQCPYVIADNTTGASESGIGTITVSGTVATLARTVVIESTNSNNLVDFAGNACGVFVTKAPGVQTGAGAADAGKVPILGSNGVLDGSLAGSIKPTQPGQFYFNPFASVFSYAPNASTLYFVWMPIAQQTTIKTISLSSYASPSAAISLEMGLYSADPTTGAPSALLIDGGAATISSNTTPQVTLPSGGFTVNAPGIWVAIGTPATLSGWSWVAFRPVSTFNFPSAQGNHVGNVNNPIVYIGYSQSWTPGALPTNISPSYANEGSNFPLVCIGT